MGQGDRVPVDVEYGLRLKAPPPTVARGWVGDRGREAGIRIDFNRRFNWLQRWAIRVVFGIEIENVPRSERGTEASTGAEVGNEKARHGAQ